MSHVDSAEASISVNRAGGSSELLIVDNANGFDSFNRLAIINIGQLLPKTQLFYDVVMDRGFSIFRAPSSIADFTILYRGEDI